MKKKSNLIGFVVSGPILNLKENSYLNTFHIESLSFKKGMKSTYNTRLSIFVF